MMQQYRIYCLNDEGRFSKVKEVKAESDDEALSFARALHHDNDCEVWAGNRLVGRVEAPGYQPKARSAPSAR